MTSPDWNNGKAYGRGELAEELLRYVRWEDGERAIVNVNIHWLREVAKLANDNHRS